MSQKLKISDSTISSILSFKSLFIRSGVKKLGITLEAGKTLVHGFTKKVYKSE